MFKENDIIRFKKGTRAGCEELTGVITKVIFITGDMVETIEVEALKSECFNLTSEAKAILKEKCDWLGYETECECMSAFYNTPMGNWDFSACSFAEIGVLYLLHDYVKHC